MLLLALLVGVASGQERPDGATIFEEHCSACHGSSGGGGVGPALAENAALEDIAEVVEQVLHGGNGMPAFGEQLSDAQIAAVVSHIRTSWGNDFAPVEASRVEEIRQSSSSGSSGTSDTPADERDEEASEPATLVIGVEPAEAEVEIVGPAGFGTQTLDGAEATLENIPAGAYRVTVTVGGEQYVQTVDLTGGGRAEVIFDLRGG